MDLIATTEIIKNMNVVYDEVLLNVQEEDFIINEVVSEEVIVEDFQEEQTMLTFDLPISASKIEDEELSTKEKITFELDQEIKDIQVKDYIELITVTEANKKGETRYVLDNYIALDSSINENDNVFEKKVVEEKLNEKNLIEELDPINSPISEFLKERADERRQKMKDFNYKFNNAKIDDKESEPAYKRQGVDIEEGQHSSETNESRLSVGLDENGDIQLRSNNSFLHDNVD